MKKKSMTAIASLVLVLTMTGVSVPAQESVEANPLDKAQWTAVQLRASVEAIDLESREVTLKGPQGNLLTLVAGEGVTRLDEVEVGDLIEVDYMTFLLVEFREPTPEEEQSPLMVLAAAGKAPADVAPEANVGAVIKAVVKVIDVDTETARVAIESPGGRFVILPVEDSVVLKHLKVGETVVMTYAEAVAASLVKTEAE